MSLFIPQSPIGLFVRLLLVFGLIMAVLVSLQSTPDISINSTSKVESLVFIPFNATDLSEISYEEIRVIEVLSGHAWQNHGDEVNASFRCLDDKGSTRSFKTSGFTDTKGNRIPTNLWLCFDGVDWYAVVTTAFQNVGSDKVARLVTAYKVAKDVFPTIDDFINYIVVKWSAYEISYVIEAGGRILLQPK